MTAIKTKTKKITKKAALKRHTPAKTRKKNSILEASKVGIAPEHILSAVPDRGLPLSLAPSFETPLALGNVGVFRRSLVSPRISFWLGVGFGILVIGVLLVLVWQILRVELAEAIVIGLVK